MLLKNRNFCQKSKLYQKIQFSLKNENFTENFKKPKIVPTYYLNFKQK